jgi:hypothetical protein
VVTQDPTTESINTIIECWDTSFVVTFQTDGSQVAGDPKECALAQALAQQP